MGSRGGIQVDLVDFPSSAFTRWEEGVERHRAVARALHGGPPARAPQLVEKLEGLRAQIAMFRARAIDLHVKLVELESQGDPDVRTLRSAMMASVVRIEGVVRELIETPEASDAPPPRLARVAAR
ncbi:MAG TPA: hypothetical protein VN253_16750 [Kofleriaceae bacterium]|nr:hypothetical protein [Kofleriaceae bacterium]